MPVDNINGWGAAYPPILVEGDGSHGVSAEAGSAHVRLLAANHTIGAGQVHFPFWLMCGGSHGVWAEGASARFVVRTAVNVVGVGNPNLRSNVTAVGFGTHPVAGNGAATVRTPATASGVYGFIATAQARIGRATGSGHFVFFSASGTAQSLRAGGSGRHGVTGQGTEGGRLPVSATGAAKHPVAGNGAATIAAPTATGVGLHAVGAQGAIQFLRTSGTGRRGVAGQASPAAGISISASGAGQRGKIWVRMIRDMGGAWSTASPVAFALDTLSVAVAATSHDNQVGWGTPSTTNRSGDLSWAPSRRCESEHVSPPAPLGVGAGSTSGARWATASRLDGGQRAAWDALFSSLAMSHRSAWPLAVRLANAARAAWPSLPAIHNATRITLHPWGGATRLERDSQQPWTRYSRVINPGWGIIIPGTPTPIPGESIIIPVRSVYLVVNEIQLFRVSNMTPISASQLNISFDCDSWLPKFSATIHKDSRETVMPDPGPVEVEASINGVQFRFFVERITRSREFARNTVNISGRGIASELEAPYAVASHHTNDGPMNAQQLIDATLTNTGYSQSWGITDWLVPANALSLYGTPAQVAGHVAEAAGAVLAADWAQRDLRMLPRYPVKPWDWLTAVPDFVIPSAVTQTDSLEWIEKPSYNVVYVSGVQTGVLAQVKITGSAGDLPAPMVTHPLITHADAGRQRGISILSDTGRKAMLQISLPVLESTGVIDICQLIEFNDGPSTRRGIVRANNISAEWPRVRQTLTVEANA